MKMYKSLLAIAMSAGLIQSAHSSPWPTAVSDSITVNVNQRVYLPVLNNDTGDNLSIREVNTTTVALGSAQLNSARNAVYYTPKSGFTGDDSFWYSIEDDQGRSNSTQVFLKVISSGIDTTTTTIDDSSTRFSAWPRANVDTTTTPKNTAITVPVLANDIGDRLSLTSVNDWTSKGGRASIQGDSVFYTPKANFLGEDTFWYNFEDARGRTNSSQVKVTVTSGDDGGGTAIIADAVRIPMHVDFLKSQRAIWQEAGGDSSTQVASAAYAGSSQLRVNSGLTLKNNQLISYMATNGQYYTVATTQSSGNVINLRTPLPEPIAQGARVWTFYSNSSHPNLVGYRSLADFALRNSDVSALNSGKHVLLGDSWFSSVGIKERLAEKLNNAQFINKGIGGNTAANLLARFDRDVASQNPQVVWVIAGTNDYYQGVSVANYKENMRNLIQKINGIGAKAVVFDSSVAPAMAGSNVNVLTDLSRQYSDALADLLNN